MNLIILSVTFTHQSGSKINEVIVNVNALREPFQKYLEAIEGNIILSDASLIRKAWRLLTFKTTYKL